MEKIGLALSGGGYRAAAYHLGTLKKLKALNILDKVDFISTISGGSIIGAYYTLHQNNFDFFYSSLYKKLTSEGVIKRVLLSYIGIIMLTLFALFSFSFYLFWVNKVWLGTGLFISLSIIIFLFQFKILPISKRIEKIYDNIFFDRKKLSDLPTSIVIGATNLQTFRPFSFSNDYMGDSSYYNKIEFVSFDFPISRAVMASSCVPFAFTPVTISAKYYKNGSQFKEIHPLIVDGGLYDNQGIHKLMHEKSRFLSKFIIVSDAGGGTESEVKLKNTFSVLNWTMESFMYRIKMQQMINSIYKNSDHYTAYCPLAWDVEKCINGFIKAIKGGNVSKEILDKHTIPENWQLEPEKFENNINKLIKIRIAYDTIEKPNEEEKALARMVGTNLTKLRKTQIDALIKQAEAITEIQVKLYCPLLIN